MTRPLSGRSTHRGFNMIEVLVAVAVLAIGLLGIAALQIQGVRYNFDSYLRSQAVVLVNDYVERMYANTPGLMAGNYGGFASASSACGTAPAQLCGRQSNNATPVACTAAQMATYDRYIAACGYPVTGGRHGGVQDLLPSGAMTVDCLNAAGAVITPCVAGSRHRLTVTWQERREAAGGTTSLQNATYQLIVEP